MTATLALLLDHALLAFAVAFLLAAAALLVTRRQPHGPAMAACLGVLTAGLVVNLWLSESAGAFWRGSHLIVLAGLVAALAEFGRRWLPRNGRPVSAVWVHVPLLAALGLLAGLGWGGPGESAADAQPVGAAALPDTARAGGADRAVVGQLPSSSESELWEEMTSQRLRTGFIVLGCLTAIGLAMGVAAVLSERRCGRQRRPAL